MRNARLTYLNETYYIIVRRTLETADQGYRLYVYSIDEHIYGFSSRITLAVDDIIRKYHHHPQKEEEEEGDEEISEHHHIEHCRERMCVAEDAAHRHDLAERDKSKKSKFLNGGMADYDTVCVEYPDIQE